jgi:hypothetical protein
MIVTGANTARTITIHVCSRDARGERPTRRATGGTAASPPDLAVRRRGLECRKRGNNVRSRRSTRRSRVENCPRLGPSL